MSRRYACHQIQFSFQAVILRPFTKCTKPSSHHVDGAHLGDDPERALGDLVGEPDPRQPSVGLAVRIGDLVPGPGLDGLLAVAELEVEADAAGAVEAGVAVQVASHAGVAVTLAVDRAC